MPKFLKQRIYIDEEKEENRLITKWNFFASKRTCKGKCNKYWRI